MIFDDDEAIALPPGPRPTVPERVELVIRNSNKAPLEENIQKVLLELIGKEKSRSGLDLVAVLDVSGSMQEDDKIGKMKLALQFMMKKLTPLDRLSIVKYSTKATRVCKLTQMTRKSQTELANLIEGWKALGSTNITDGLTMGLNVLNGRTIRDGRVGVIMLMTDGQENRSTDASKVKCNVTVHTFGFGDCQDSKRLMDIAKNSPNGGTYSEVRLENLNLAFSQCLAGLLSVVAQDLTVTVRQLKDESTINKVSAGSYAQAMDNAAGSVTITFGDIYMDEIRKVLVDLHLPATGKEQDADVLEVSYAYKFDGELYEASPTTVTVCRMLGLTDEERQALPEVRAEEVRLLIAEVIKQATTDADKADLESARYKLVDGLKTLGDAGIEMLKAELEELRRLFQTKQIYDKEGHPFACSLLISLGTQRQTARGDNISKFQLFATPIMQEFLEEAKFYYIIDSIPMSFNDHDPIVLLPDSGLKHIIPERVELVIRNSNKAPLEENFQKVVLELIGKEKSRSGLDLVAVLDVSDSMRDDNKLEEMKSAMQFVMTKLSPMDRLSIVSYSSRAKRVCKLSQMTKNCQAILKNLITNLKAGGSTNISDGLQMGLNVLNDRSFSDGRVGVIMLMTDGMENKSSDAANVPLGNVPVHTFGFGNGHDLKVLKAIADNSRMGGTYSDVRMHNLSLAFSQCLGGLLSVVVQDLTVTVRQLKDESTINKVSAGSYPQSMDNAASSVTITFGDIYMDEIRKVLVDLHLPATGKEQDADVLEVSYAYKFGGELYEASPTTVTVCRMLGLTNEEQQALPEVRAEEVYLLIAEVIKQATTDADKQDMESARYKLVDGLKTLGDAGIEMLKAELEELHILFQTQEIYHNEGRPFAYSLLVSLGTQRQTARGNDISKFLLFATPIMQEFLEEIVEIDDFMRYSMFPFTMLYKDDGQIVLPPDLGPIPIEPGRVQLLIRNNPQAPLEKNIHKVLLELSAEEYSLYGLDVVAVLDVSSSMDGDNLANMKKAMLYLMNNLSLIDRLSIVKYSSKVKRLCPLRQMTESSQTELKSLVEKLKALPGTNMTNGLKTALNVLKDRSVSSGRVGIIILMSDGKQNIGSDAAEISVGKIPVHTFGFGEDQNLKALMAIANNSRQGTYSDIRMDNLHSTFSHCLDELQSVVAWDLKVTVTQYNDDVTLKRVSVARYPQSDDKAAGSVTIEFGNLYMKEVRKVLVDLVLHASKEERKADMLKISYTYSFDGQLVQANPVILTIQRKSEEPQVPLEVTAEEVRMLIAEVIKQATCVANKEVLKSVRDNLVHSMKTLGGEGIEQCMAKLRNEMQQLRTELEELSELIQKQAINEQQGRSFAYSLLISHATQRGPARGNNIDKYQLFATPAMREFLEEAQMYDEIDDLNVYMDRYICAIECIEMIMEKV